jgi:hypothetical protein
LGQCLELHNGMFSDHLSTVACRNHAVEKACSFLANVTVSMLCGLHGILGQCLPRLVRPFA